MEPQDQSKTKLFPNENNFADIEGFLITLTEQPSYVPRKLSEQVVIVTAGGSTSAYFYDRNNTAWNQVSLTTI